MVRNDKKKDRKQREKGKRILSIISGDTDQGQQTIDYINATYRMEYFRSGAGNEGTRTFLRTESEYRSEPVCPTLLPKLRMEIVTGLHWRRLGYTALFDG